MGATGVRTDSRRSKPRIPSALRARTLPDAIDPNERYDCVYSISVLEHVPEESLSGLWKGIRRLAAGGIAIHAIDHVLLGPGDAAHRAHLSVVVREAGIDPAQLDEQLLTIDGDSDAYFLSAEAHNMWRGSQAYDAFPMRRCVSIQLCIPLKKSPRQIRAQPVCHNVLVRAVPTRAVFRLDRRTPTCFVAQATEPRRR